MCRSRISKSLKFRIHQSNDWVCHYCGKQLIKIPEGCESTSMHEECIDGRFEFIFCYTNPDIRCPRSKFPCVDHKTPISQGGTNRRENLTTACWDCNLQKSDRYTEEEFLAIKRTSITLNTRTGSRRRTPVALNIQRGSR